MADKTEKVSKRLVATGRVSWSDPSIWEPPGVPTQADTVAIDTREIRTLDTTGECALLVLEDRPDTRL